MVGRDFQLSTTNATTPLYSALVIDAHGPARVEQVQSAPEALSSLVGGWLEAITGTYAGELWKPAPVIAHAREIGIVAAEAAK